MGVQNLQKKHHLLQSELTSHESRTAAVTREAQEMVAAEHYGAKDITARLDHLSRKWQDLKVVRGKHSHYTLSSNTHTLSLSHTHTHTHTFFFSDSLSQALAEARGEALERSLQAQQYLSDAQEAESWMKEKEPLVNSGDYGKDEDSAQVREHC